MPRDVGSDIGSDDSGEDKEKKAKASAAGVTLEGRRLQRGFTVAMGSRSSAEDKEEAELDFKRSNKRAQTLPSTSERRGDWTGISEASLKELQELNKALVARWRRGSVGVAFDVVPEEELQRCWKETTTGFMHGKMTDGQTVADERERAVYGSGELPDGTVISCTKGSKGFRDTTPNQDNFSLAYFKNGWTMACCMDGHGPFGHIVSTRAVQTVPYYMTNSEQWEKDMPAALVEAFERAQKELLALSLQDSWDIQASGSTAVAAIWKGNQIYTANVGDSRCVVGYQSTRKMVFETEDHKPNSELEQKRIEAAGGEVRSQTYPDGWTVHRIFVKGQDFPGLCMTRTLGDQSVKDHGVIATPEVKLTEVDLTKEAFMLLASDGVWEFLDSEFVIKAVAKKIASDGPERTVQKLQREARKRWKQEEGDYCDDITSLLVQFK